MADVLTVMTGQGVVGLGGDAAKSGGDVVRKADRGGKPSSVIERSGRLAPRREISIADFNKYNQNHGERGRFATANAASRQVVAVNAGILGEGGKEDTPEEDLSEQLNGVGPTGRANRGRTLTPDMPAVGGYGAPASSFSGSSRFQIQDPAGVPPRNDPATIDGVPYSGHALDQMQNRGLFPSVTGQAIQHGSQGAGNRPDTNVFYDRINNVSVIRNSTTGKVLTVIPGDRRRGLK